MKKHNRSAVARFMLPIFVVLLTAFLLVLAPNSMAHATGETIDSPESQTKLPNYDIDGIQATQTYFFDWGAVGAINPTSFPWVQTFTNVGGSGVDVTLTIPRAARDTNYKENFTGANDVDVQVYTNSTTVFRYFKQQDTTIDQITVSFSRPVQVNNLVFGGNRLTQANHATLEFNAFAGPSVTGSVVLPDDIIHPDPSILTTIIRGDAIPNPSTFPFYITDSPTVGTPDLNGAYVGTRESYVTVGLTDQVNWAIVNYQEAMIQSFSWELYGSSVTNPLTARENLDPSGAISAYLGSFEFTVTDYDYGDLPDGYNTTFPNNGAAHAIGDLYLGGCVDAEYDGLPGAPATGDDLDPDSGGFLVGTCTNNNDEDGIVRNFTVPWRPGNTVTIDVTVTGGTGRLAGWFDWDGSGFFDASEFVDFGTISGTSTPLPLPIPSNYTAGADLSARFRLFDPNSTVDGADFERRAVNGEVEDYVWQFTPTAVTLQSYSVTGSNSLPVIAFIVFAFVTIVSFGIYIFRRKQYQA